MLRSFLAGLNLINSKNRNFFLTKMVLLYNTNEYPELDYFFLKINIDLLQSRIRCHFETHSIAFIIRKNTLRIQIYLYVKVNCLHYNKNKMYFIKGEV